MSASGLKAALVFAARHVSKVPTAYILLAWRNHRVKRYFCGGGAPFSCVETAFPGVHRAFLGARLDRANCVIYYRHIARRRSLAREEAIVGRLHAVSAVACCAAVLSVLIAIAHAGRENVAFPAYQSHVLYDVLDQPDIAEIREAYINPEALKKYRPGTPFPSGTVLTMPTFRALRNEKGDFVRDANGRLVRGPLDRIVVMEKRAGWGAEYPETVRNGEWEYERFKPDGTRDPTASIPGCFQCHKPFEKLDYVFTIQEIVKFKER